MFRLRFGILSVSAMLVATSLATFAVLRPQGDGFGGHRGFPFAWYSWPDVIMDGRVPGHYVWPGLVEDILVWAAAILAIGVLVDRVGGRRLGSKESSNAT